MERWGWGLEKDVCGEYLWRKCFLVTQIIWLGFGAFASVFEVTRRVVLHEGHLPRLRGEY